MGSAIELYEARKVELSYLQTVGEVLAKSHFFDDAQTAERAVAKILAGQEFGMGALESMRAFHVIDGKVEMSADAQARLVKAHERYDYHVNTLTDDECEIVFIEDERTAGISTFTMEDARRAGVVKGGGAWEKYPRNMLFARALTNGVAWFCPDAISGGRVYAPGETSGEAWDVGTPIEVEPVVGSATPLQGGGMAEIGGETDAEGTNTQGASSVDPEGSGVQPQGEDAAPDPELEEPETSVGDGKLPESDAVSGAEGRERSGPPDLSDTPEERKEFRAYLADTYGTAQALLMARELFQTKARPVPNLTKLDLSELLAVDAEFKERKLEVPVDA